MKNIFFKNTAVIIFLLLTVSIYAEGNNPEVPAAEKAEDAAETEILVITREKAVEMALSHSRTLKESRIDYEQAERISSNSWNELFPGFSVSGSVASSAETESFSADRKSVEWKLFSGNVIFPES